MLGDATLPEFSEETQKEITQLCRMLSDPTRLKILLFLGRETELHVTALCQRLGQSQPAVSHHLALLKNSGLIDVRRDGKHNFYFVCKPYCQMLLGQLFEGVTNPPSESRFEGYAMMQA